MTLELGEKHVGVRLQKLSNLEKDLANFNSDRINLIHTYLPKTGIETSIIAILEGLRKTLFGRSNPSLNRKYQMIKSDFRALLLGRISYIKHPQSAKNDNIWLGELQKTSNNSLGYELERSGSHWADLAFECKVVIDNKLTQATKSCIDDLNVFREQRLNITLDQLHRANGETYTKEVVASLFKEMEAAMEKLENALLKKEFDGAEELLSKITELASGQLNFEK